LPLGQDVEGLRADRQGDHDRGEGERAESRQQSVAPARDPERPRSQHAKDKVEAAIKRASGQGGQAFEQILYEGYAPHGCGLADRRGDDNPVRTAGNLRAAFNKYGGNLAANGLSELLFRHMASSA